MQGWGGGGGAFRHAGLEGGGGRHPEAWLTEIKRVNPFLNHMLVYGEEGQLWGGWRQAGGQGVTGD